MASASVPASPSPSLRDTCAGKRPGERALEAVRAQKRQKPDGKKDMLPPAPRPVVSSVQAPLGPKVVDDDEFEAKLAAIIERDYFPDIKRLQNKLEWTQATESGEADRIANAQRNIVLRRAGFSVTSSRDLPATPDRSQSGPHTSSSNATPATPGSDATEKADTLPEGSILPPQQDVASFTARHTTEDQASLDSILAADNARRRMRHRWAYEESDRANAHMIDAGHQPGLLLTAPDPSTVDVRSSEAVASLTDAPSSSTAADTTTSSPDQPSQANHHPAALVITLPDDGGTPRRRARRAHPMPVFRSSHAAPPSRAALAAAKALRAKALVQAQAKANPHSALLHNPKSALYYPPDRSLPLSLNERRLMSAGAPPQTIAAHTRFPSSSESASHSRAGSESPSTLASTPSGVISESPGYSSEGVDRYRLAKGNHIRGPGDGDAQEKCDEGKGDLSVDQIGGGARMGAVATPSPANLGTAAPIMTWGEVAGTPIVLEEEDLFRGEELRVSRGVLQGPRCVKESAADSARKEIAQDHRKPYQTLQHSICRRRGEQSSRTALSPAARNFVKKLQGRSPWSQLDTQLRASYGHRTPGTTSRSGLPQTTGPAPIPAGTSSLASASPRGLLSDMTPERHA